VSTWFVPGKSPIRLSSVHRRIMIDTRTGLAVCPPYDERHDRAEVFEFWPSDVLRLFVEAGIPRRPPPQAAACPGSAAAGEAPRISSPRTHVTYTVRAARVGSETVPLIATADGGARRIYWFKDDAYLGESSPDLPLAFAPQSSGVFMLRAVDDAGRADSRELRVAIVP
jgi:penicillin-binding protein 1C